MQVTHSEFSKPEIGLEWKWGEEDEVQGQNSWWLGWVGLIGTLPHLNPTCTEGTQPDPYFSQCGVWGCDLSPAWVPARNADCQALPQACWIINFQIKVDLFLMQQLWFLEVIQKMKWRKMKSFKIHKGCLLLKESHASSLLETDNSMNYPFLLHSLFPWSVSLRVGIYWGFC